MLLLGYSVEMFLKAGLVKAYYGCSEAMFDRDIKKRFGHNLVSMANELAFSVNQDDITNLNSLANMVLLDARYPVFVPHNASYSHTVNQQTERIWSEQNFTILTELANRIRKHSKTIDADSDNPVSLESYTVDADGYLAFRIGGHLPPRITYRPSSIQRTSGKSSLDDMKALFRNSRFLRLKHCWHRAWIYEDGCRKTSRMRNQRPDGIRVNDVLRRPDPPLGPFNRQPSVQPVHRIGKFAYRTRGPWHIPSDSPKFQAKLATADRHGLTRHYTLDRSPLVNSRGLSRGLPWTPTTSHAILPRRSMLLIIRTGTYRHSLRYVTNLRQWIRCSTFNPIKRWSPRFSKPSRLIA